MSNVLKPFFTKLGFKAENKSLKGQISIDLCLFKKDKTSVLIEAKLPTNDEFPQLDDFSKKGLHQAIFYYLWERKVELNLNISYIIITDFKRFYIIDIQEFCARFYHEETENAFDKFYNKEQRLFNSTDYFYDEIYNILKNEKYSHKYLTQKSENLFDDKGNAFDLSPSINGIYLDLTPFIDKDKDDEKLFEDAFKILSKDFLNNEFSIKDANEINEPFYKELLYILGLEEKTEKGKNLIKHNNVKNSVYDLVKRHLSDKNQLSNEEEKDNEVIMGFIIVWLNRILFIKLIEGNLIKFNDKSAAFFNKEFIKDFSDLNYLFFEVFAKNFTERSESKFPALPYLNSSLFDKKDFENNLMEISILDNFKPKICTYHKGDKFELFSYLIDFLNSYNFSSQGETKKLINPSILGKIFEKLNGYKDGSIFTPAEITMYMCRTSLEKVVLGKFNDKFKWQCENLDDLRLQIDRNFTQINRADFLSILKDIKICDPAVGSGHFLVSALNEMIKIYHTLGLLDFRCENIDIINDELVINNGKYTYKRNDANTFEIQKGLFHLKQTIIENNLFGVDINPKSVEICKLRLWIELLKNSYYLLKDDEKFNPNLSKEFHQMQTLPNIDINIKCGNSLLSNIELSNTMDNFLANLNKREAQSTDLFAKEELSRQKADLQKKFKLAFDAAKEANLSYKNSSGKEARLHKDEFEKQTNFLNQLFLRNCDWHIDFYMKLREFFRNYGYKNLKTLTDEERITIESFVEKFEFHKTVQDYEREKERIIQDKDKKELFKALKTYEEAINTPTFEWRFEFPEVLNESGEFMGFDLVVGNPPYVLILKEHKDYIKYKQSYKTASGGKINLYNLFFENSLKLIKRNGFLSFITPNTYLSGTDTKNLREILLNETSIYEIIEYTEKQKVFDKVTQAVATIFLTNQKLSNHQIKLTTSKQGEQICLQDDLRKRNLLLAISPLILKIEQQKARLKDCFDIFQGEVNLTTKKQFFSLEKGENRLLMWRGDNVGKYYPQSQPKEWCDKKATTRNDFEKERIVMQEVSNQSLEFRTKAFISDKGFICGHSTNYLVSKHNENLLFYLGLINSRIFNFYVNYFSFTNHITVSGLEKVPIPTINSKNQSLVDEIINLVDKILALKAKNSTADTSQLECDIDDLVFKLYDLNEVDISKIKF